MEEEIIKNANEIIYNAECWIDDEECTDAELEWGKFEKNTVQGLLDLYNKEKEKSKKCEYYEEIADELYKANQAHQKLNGELRIKVKELEKKVEELENQMGKDLDVVYLKAIYDERDKWKNKIKEKIKKLETRRENEKGYKGLEYSRTGLLNAGIQVLQELLGE